MWSTARILLTLTYFLAGLVLLTVLQTEYPLRRSLKFLRTGTALATDGKGSLASRGPSLVTNNNIAAQIAANKSNEKSGEPVDRSGKPKDEAKAADAVAPNEKTENPSTAYNADKPTLVEPKIREESPEVKVESTVPAMLMELPPTQPDSPQTILEYINGQSVWKNEWILFRWFPDGTPDPDSIERSSNNNKGWAPKRFLETNLEPSKHGRVVLAFNSDHSHGVDWTIEPPVPVVTFTAPEQHPSNIHLIVNPYDYGFNGWCISEANNDKTKFEDRVDKRIAWRGQLHNKLDEKPRVIALAMGSNHTNDDWLDIKSTEEDSLSIAELGERKYQLDLPGLSGSSWGATRWKMCNDNSLVFRVIANFDWWYHTMEPWKHYIPVKSDLSDLHDQWEWAENHPDEALAILKAGRDKCLETTTDEARNENIAGAISQFTPATEALAAEAYAIVRQELESGLIKEVDNKKSDAESSEEISQVETAIEEESPEVKVESNEPVQEEVPPTQPDSPHTILEYINGQSVWKNEWILFRWFPDGTPDPDSIERSSNNNKGWAPKRFLETNLEPSKHGRVVLAFNSDHSHGVDWTIEPPVPVVTFTAPEQHPSNIHLIVNPYDYGFNGWCISEANNDKTKFEDRVDKRIAWRGQLHNKLDEKPRVIALAMGSNHTNDDWLDIKSTEEDSLSIAELGERKYQLDLPGLSGSSWGATRWKMCNDNSLVFRVIANFDWWYHTMEPWKHYIPVKSDLSDLHDQWEWAENHPDEALAILKAGRDKCLETTTDEARNENIASAISQFTPATEALAAEADAIVRQELESGLIKKDQ